MNKTKLTKAGAVALPLLLVGSLSFAGGASSAAKIARLMVGKTASAIKKVMVMSPEQYSAHAMRSLKNNESLVVVQGAEGSYIGNLVKTESQWPVEGGYKTFFQYGFVGKSNAAIKASIDDFMKNFDQSELALFEDLIPQEALKHVGKNPRIIIQMEEEALGFAQRLNPIVRITGDNVSGTGLMGTPAYTLSNDVAINVALRALLRDGIVVGKKAVSTGANGL